MYRFQKGSTPPIISELFATGKNKYNLGNFQVLESSYNEQ